MSYYLARSVNAPFDDVVTRLTKALKDEGFGVLTDIDVSATIKAKLGKEFRNYRILGACNPALAYQALSAEDKIGVMLPCNVIVQDLPDGGVEIAAVDPAQAMARVGNPDLRELAEAVRHKLAAAVAAA